MVAHVSKTKVPPGAHQGHQRWMIRRLELRFVLVRGHYRGSLIHESWDPGVNDKRVSARDRVRVPRTYSTTEKNKKRKITTLIVSWVGVMIRETK
ncbi:hypothetical protein PV325_013747 [Microctonus aethiopoides]|nr:hypothetical protein PV325_013747 [Microctonus aethiopoides]